MVVLGYIVQLGEHPVFAIDTALSQMEILHVSKRGYLVETMK